MSSNDSPTGFERLRDAVLQSPELQQRLRDVTDEREFISAAVELGAELGLVITSADVATAMSSSGRRSVATNPTLSKLADWMPMKVSNDDSGLAVDWCYMGRSRFTQPFFEDTIRQRLRMPFSRTFTRRTSGECVGRLVDSRPDIPPTGFIFHMSRCGSTLVSQMLAAVDRNIVISEAPPIDSVLNPNITGVDDERRSLLLRWIIGAFGQKRFDEEQYFFIKFDSWNTLDLDLIRRTFPSVPWIFLYRDPVEVIVSQMRQRGLQMVPGAVGKLLPEISLEEAVGIPVEEYCARILERICEAAIAHAADPNALLVNYSQLPGAASSAILDHFRVTYNEDEISKMQNAANFNAKTPQLFFEPDSALKRAEATDAVRRAALRVEPLYFKLQNLRFDKS